MRSSMVVRHWFSVGQRRCFDVIKMPVSDKKRRLQEPMRNVSAGVRSLTNDSLKGVTAPRALGCCLPRASTEWALHRRFSRSLCTVVMAEHNNKDLTHCTLSAVKAAKEFQHPIVLLIVGSECGSVSDQASKLAGVSHVCEVNHKAYEHFLADNVAEVVSEILTRLSSDNADAKAAIIGKCQGPAVALVGAVSSVTRDIFPRVAAMHDVQPISDVTNILEEGQVFQRPMYAGNAIATLKSSDALKIVSVRSTAFIPEEKSTETKSSGNADISKFEFDKSDELGRRDQSKWIKDEVDISEKPQLGTAKVVVSGGRALKSAESFDKLLEPLCRKLKAAMGASRAAVDAGFAPNDLQVGQTGKIVAPNLYIAVGISGAIQHLAGMKDSKTIVAINKDPDCPIFQVADYGLVGDLFTILPELTEKLSQQ